MKPTIIGAILILGTLNTAHADTLVFRDTLRPHGHDRGRVARLGAGRQCGGYRNGDFPTAMTESYTQCMQARGWTLDHVIPSSPSAYAHAPSFGSSPAPIENSVTDHDIARERNDIQNMVNQQQQNDIQRMNQDQFDQQQQIINNNRLND
jgi:hypothetical protein